MPHHEALTVAAPFAVPTWLWFVAALGVNARAGWRRLRELLWRQPKAPAVTLDISLADLVRIQPAIEAYVDGLTRTGFTHAAGVIRVLNELALSASTSRGALGDVRYQLDEAASLLREPLDFSSPSDWKRIRQARTIIHTQLNHLQEN